MSAMFVALVAACGIVLWPSSVRAERPLFAPRRQVPSSDGPLDIAFSMELLALALAGGAPTLDAVEAVHAARTASVVPGAAAPSASEAPSTDGHDAALARVGAALRWGVDERSAWGAATSAWRPVATAFDVSARCGAAPSTLLRRAADDLRLAESERVQTAGAKAGVLVVLPLGVCFLPAFVLLTIVPMILGLVRLPG